MQILLFEDEFYHHFLCISMADITEQGSQSLAEILFITIHRVIYIWLAKGIALAVTVCMNFVS